jgi:hypothetical protein
MIGPAKGTKPRESEHEEEQEQEQEHMKGHKDPLCLKVGEWKFKRKDKQGQEGLSSDEERRLNYPPLKEAVPLHPYPGPVLDRLCNMSGQNLLTASQVCNRPRQLQHPVKRPRRQVQLLHRCFEQLLR